VIRPATRQSNRRVGRILGAAAATSSLAFGVATAALAPACRAAAAPLVVRDDLGHEVTFAHPPQRIISLLPPLTETVCALGECARLVATDRYSNWPDSVKALPKTGGLEDPLIEAIVRLRPDLVLLSSSQRITGRLRELGIESFALDTQTYAHISRVITVIGRILDVPERAAALNRRIDSEVREIAAQAIARRRGVAPSVYFEVDPGPYAAGAESFIGEVLTRLGARNIVDASLGPFPKLNPEYVVRRNPDVIFISPADAPHLGDRPGWNQIRAVREKRICSFSPEVRDTIVHGGPRIVDGMRAIADCLARVEP
jgi:iron complex transport system substrate-binding protein